MSRTEIDINQVAKGLHIGIIMDGNGRWAKRQGKTRTAGHVKGAKVFQEITKYCNELALYAVTYYAFSTENWARPETEVRKILNLLKEYLNKAYDFEKENNRICILGDKTPFDEETRMMMNEIEEKTKDRTGMILNIAINYGGRTEIARAAQLFAKDVQQGKIAPDEITAERFEEHLYTAGQKDPDIILRPSGEKRLSNFMLWQAAYAEFISMDVLWPDFTAAHLDKAILEYAGRSRRFGAI